MLLLRTRWWTAPRPTASLLRRQRPAPGPRLYVATLRPPCCPAASPSTRWAICSRLQRVVSYGYTLTPHLQYRRRARTAAAEFVRFFFKPGNMLCRVLSITLGKLSCSVSVRQTSSSFTLLRSRQDTRERLRRVLGKIHTAKDLCRRDVCRVHFAVCQHTAKSLPCSAAPLPCIF
jgi:hypothetical protein